MPSWVEVSRLCHPGLQGLSAKLWYKSFSYGSRNHTLVFMIFNLSFNWFLSSTYAEDVNDSWEISRGVAASSTPWVISLTRQPYFSILEMQKPPLWTFHRSCFRRRLQYSPFPIASNTVFSSLAYASSVYQVNLMHIHTMNSVPVGILISMAERLALFSRACRSLKDLRLFFS